MHFPVLPGSDYIKKKAAWKREKNELYHFALLEVFKYFIVCICLMRACGVIFWAGFWIWLMHGDHTAVRATCRSSNKNHSKQNRKCTNRKKPTRKKHNPNKTKTNQNANDKKKKVTFFNCYVRSSYNLHVNCRKHLVTLPMLRAHRQCNGRN